LKSIDKDIDAGAMKGRKKKNLYFRSFIVCGVMRLRADDEGQAKCSK